MKTLKTFLLFFMGTCLLPNSFLAQNFSHYTERDAGFWSLGINAGSAYQRNIDVANQYKGFGLGLTLGKNLYYRPNGFFSFDLRGRLLYAESYGLDGGQSTGLKNNLALNGVGRSFETDKLNYTQPTGLGYYFANYKTQNGSLDLEGVLTFNRLRERTGIVLSVFGGVGLDLYQARINQRNDAGLYTSQYKSVDKNDFNTARVQLKNILDNSYETIADGNQQGGTLTWMPTLGAEIGYQFAPRFHASLFHKINFTRSDVFDGQQWDNTNTTTYENDWQHYTGLKLEWELGKSTTENRPPRIEILAPDQNPYFTETENVHISAKISNIKNGLDVSYKLNGEDAQFNFYNPRLNSDIKVLPGRNELEIQATNPYGTDRKLLIIIYKTSKKVETPEPPVYHEPTPPVVVAPSTPTPKNEPPVIDRTPELPRPVVTITTPYRSPFTTENDNTTIGATVLNVKNYSDIHFTVNGRERNFNFNPNTGIFSSTIALDEGRNDLNIEASNRTGRDQASATIIYERPHPKVYPPTVRITQPQNNRQEIENQYFTLIATTSNVSNKSDIQVSINGYNAIFSFDTYRNTVRADLTLSEGENNILVQVSNAGGNDSDQKIVIFRKKIVPPPPTVEKPSVTINAPYNGQTFSVKNTVLEARTLGVSDKKDIRVYVNNSLQRDFSFNLLTKKITMDVKLQQGTNTISVRADNSAGSDVASVSVNYIVEKPKTSPPSVRIESPSNGTTTNSDNTLVSAYVTNIRMKNQLYITNNGQRIIDFNLLGNQIEFSTRLQEGDNTISIQAENEGGKDQASISVTYKKIIPPVVTGRNPRTELPKDDAPVIRNPRTPRTELPTTENNTPTPNPSTPSTGRVPRLPRSLPTVTITSASQNVGDPMSPATGACTVLALIKNVSNKEQITFTVNGMVKSFDFDAATGNFSADFDLEKGENTIVIKADTALGKAQDTRVVVY